MILDYWIVSHQAHAKVMIYSSPIHTICGLHSVPGSQEPKRFRQKYTYITCIVEKYVLGSWWTWILYVEIWTHPSFTWGFYMLFAYDHEFFKYRSWCCKVYRLNPADQRVKRFFFKSLLFLFRLQLVIVTLLSQKLKFNKE